MSDHQHFWAALEDTSTGGRRAICARCELRKVFEAGRLQTDSEIRAVNEPPRRHDHAQVAQLISGISRQPIRQAREAVTRRQSTHIDTYQKAAPR